MAALCAAQHFDVTTSARSAFRLPPRTKTFFPIKVPQRKNVHYIGCIIQTGTKLWPLWIAFRHFSVSVVRAVNTKMDIILTVDPLNLSSLDTNTVNDVWTDRFSGDSDLPIDYQDYLQQSSSKAIMYDIITSIQTNLNCGALEKWQSLVDGGLLYKPLLCVIHHFLCSALQNKLDRYTRESGLYAASLYFTLLAVPDCAIYSIYQSSLFLRALEVLLFANLMKRTTSPSRGRGPRGGRGPRSPEENEESEELPSHEINKLSIELNRTLKHLEFCLDKSKIGKCDDAASQIIEVITKLTRLGALQSDSSTDLVNRAFKCLLKVCRPCHGNIAENVRLVMRCMLISIQLPLQKDNGFSNREASIIKDQAISFVHLTLTSLGSLSYHGIKTLVEHLCWSAPERAEPRLKAVEDVVNLVKRFPDSLFSHSLKFFMTMSLHDKSSYRIFALEVIEGLLYLEERQANMEDTDEEITDYVPNIPSHEYLLASVFSHTLDISATVRTKALCILSRCLTSGTKEIKSSMAGVFVLPYLKVCDVRKVKPKTVVPFRELVCKLSESPPRKQSLDVLPDGFSVVENLVFLSEDDKVMVRKAALLALFKIMLLNFKFIRKSILEVVCAHSQDKAVLIRKMVVQEMTTIMLRYPDEQTVSNKWIENILPMMADPEVKVVEKVSEVLKLAILDNLVPLDKMSHPKHQLPWALLQQMSTLKMGSFFSKAFDVWKKENVFRPSQLVSVIQSHIGSTNNMPAWFLLMSLSGYVDIPSPVFVLNYYHQEVRNVHEVSIYLSQLVIEVLWCSWKHLPNDKQKSLADELCTDLLRFNVPVHLITRSVNLCYNILRHQTQGDSDLRVCTSPDWAANLIMQCEKNIFEMLSSNPNEIRDQEGMKRFIITIGEAALVCPNVVQDDTVKQLICMLEPSSSHADNMWRGSCSILLKAGLLITLGKLSLQSEQRAQLLLFVLGPMLRSSRNPTLTNNIMICLTDLCFRYTSRVEGLLPDMSVCLRDPLRDVRENSLRLLIQLLVEDYLKMKNGLIFHLLSMINDEDPHISALTRSFFENTVLPKKKSCFVSNFIPAILHYNQYQNHHRYSRVSLTPIEEEVFCLSGAENMKQRQNIYKFMLQSMEDDHRYSVSQLLCADILVGVLDGTVVFSEMGQWVLKDTLFILGCEEIHMTEKDTDDDVDVDDEEIAQMFVISARKKVFSQLMKKHIAESEIPTLVELHKKLSAMGSSLVRDILRCLKSLTCDYEGELNEVLKGERQLAMELQQFSSNSGGEGSFSQYAGSSDFSYSSDEGD